MTRVYISGPMTGLPEHNFPAFHAAAKELRDAGVEAVSPAEIEVGPSPTWKQCLCCDIKELLTCTHVTMLPGYDQSRGACLELGIAACLDFDVYKLDWMTLRDYDRAKWFMVQMKEGIFPRDPKYGRNSG